MLQRHGSWAASSALSYPSPCQHALPSPCSGQRKGASASKTLPPPSRQPPSCLLWLNKALCSLLTPVRLSVVGQRWGKFLVCEGSEGPATHGPERGQRSMRDSLPVTSYSFTIIHISVTRQHVYNLSPT